MHSIFVAQWFDEADRDLVMHLDEILYSHGVTPVTGHVLGGRALEDGVKEKIVRSDGLVALATRRDERGEGGWVTHPWVVDEYQFAKAHNMKAIALVEEGVEWRGMYADHEYIPLERPHPYPALLKVSQTLAQWKRSAGSLLKLRLLPEDLAERVESSRGEFECRYRFVEQGEFSEWREADPVPEPGGVFLYVKCGSRGQLVQVRVRSDRGTWQSPATPQSMPIALKRA